MGPTDARRFELQRELRKLLGVTVTDTLMDYLPPDGWSDVARRHDIEMILMRFDKLDARIESVQYGLSARMDGLETGLTARMDALESGLTARMDALESRLTARMDGLDKRVDGLDGRRHRQPMSITTG